MSLNAAKVRNFIVNAFRGNKSEERNNVRWEAVAEKETEEDFEERRPSESVDFLPEGLSERSQLMANVAANGDNIQVTRASVYVRDEDEAFQKATGKVINNMNNPDVTLSEPKNPANVTVRDDFVLSEENAPSVTQATEEKSLNKMCYGPDLTFSLTPKPSALSTFVRDVENELRVPSKVCAVINDGSWTKGCDSSNSLNIQRELDELMRTLCPDLEEKKNPSNNVEQDVVSSQTCSSVGGSQVNLGYVKSEENENVSENVRICEEEVPDVSRKHRPIRSKSFGERRQEEKKKRGGKHRMSDLEFGSKRSGNRKVESGEADFAVADSRHPRFLRLAFDRSSVVEARVGSAVSLPRRPRSALEERRAPASSSESSLVTVSWEDFPSSPSSNPSMRVSETLDECIDWSWLEEATRNLCFEIQELSSIKSASSRVDAGCQTQCSWEDEERMSNGAPSPRASAAVGAASECGELGSGGWDEEMPRKPVVEGTGTSGVSSWLRQSMRRVRHFNLEDPPRIRSAPPDGARAESTAAGGGPAVAVTNPQGNTEVAQQDLRWTTEENRPERNRSRRPRPFSTPARRSFRELPVPDAPSPSPTSEILDNLGYESDSTDRHPSPRSNGRRNAEEEGEEVEGRSPLGSWPHGLSSVLAGLGCTLGLFNISRFAVLSVHFGSNFILQFLILSLALGVPLLAFHMALGQTLGAGPVDMWKISPLFQGVGIALLLAQALIGMYSIVGVSWMFVYFRDSFITKQDAFRWAEPFRHYREDNIFATSILNMSGRLEETVPDYLNGVVLQRYGLTSPENAFGHLKFQLTFNLAVVWMIVFVSLSKGLRSYGKVVYVFSVVPVLGVLVMCSKLLALTPLHRGFFPQTEWSEFFLNAKSWISAATEVVLTWNLLGAAAMQVASHNRSSKKLWRDVATISLLTLLVLILAAFLGNMCHQIISIKGYSYVPSSFERISTYSFLRPSGSFLPPSYSTPVRHMAHASLVAGERVGKPGAIHESGYQVIRLATELVPATLAILDGNYLSPFWAVLFYFTLILFGVAQQLAIWHCVITGIMAINATILKSWETTITFFTCAAGFILGLPMTTELGIFVVYFLDYCLGGGWWLILLTLTEICAVLMVRGRPYSGENISIALFGKATNCISLWAVPLLTFTWNVIMPVALLVLCITIFKSGGYRDLWVWRCGTGDYWPLWTREVGVFVQVIPLLCIPIVAIVQCYRYLSKGPEDIFDRLGNLYRPAVSINGIVDEEIAVTNLNLPSTETGTNGTTELPSSEDPPPKYTPPPSYSTATGARIAKLLRQSFRRSIRRIQSALGPDSVHPPRPPPPDYASVLVEMNHNGPPANVGFTAADVAQVLRCSFRRTNSPDSQTSHERTTNGTPLNLVIPPRRGQ